MVRLEKAGELCPLGSMSVSPLIDLSVHHNTGDRHFSRAFSHMVTFLNWENSQSCLLHSRSSPFLNHHSSSYNDHGVFLGL
jgi:hypothetical protein